LTELAFDRIIPDKKGIWINQTENDFENLIPLIDKEVKAGKSQQAIFKLFSSGIKTQRDEWVYDFSEKTLKAKMRYFVGIYQKTVKNNEFEDKLKIKWDRELDKYKDKRVKKRFNSSQIVKSLYRPFTAMWLYFDKHFNGMTYQWPNILENNLFICLSGLGGTKSFQAMLTDKITCLDALEKTQCIPLYAYDSTAKKQDNITDWALEQFRKNYSEAGFAGFKDLQDTENPDNPVNPASDEDITKEDIFHYVYAVLHNPAYREKYAQNLKREFPRIPFYPDFWQWAAWGKQLMDLHLNYETAPLYPLKREENPLKNPNMPPKTKLKADTLNDRIEIDEKTTLCSIPKSAWEYKLGNRCALEWILDQYKEKKPGDPTIAEKFNTYRFADYKEHVIELLQRVCATSVETMKIIEEMRKVAE
jgi:predicted helicase